MSEMMITNSLVEIKEMPPYTPELEVPVLLNAMARATLDVKTGSYSFPKNLRNEVRQIRQTRRLLLQLVLVSIKVRNNSYNN